MDGWRIRSDSDFQIDKIGNDIRRATAMDTAARNDRELFGPNLFVDYALQSYDNVASDQNGVNAEIRTTNVAAFAKYTNIQRIDGR